MSKLRVAILGFGTVGQGVYRILNERQHEIEEATGYVVEVVKILVKDPTKKRPATRGVVFIDTMEAIWSDPKIDVIFEAIVGEEPARSYLSKAINKRIHVVTANKEMFAKHGEDLLQQAQLHNVQVGYEATTAGGVPIIRTITNLQPTDSIRSIRGILNGTSNYILTKMREEGVPFKAALHEAQTLGYAEADPTDDISGRDAFRKLMILSALAFGEQPNWSDVPVAGITNVMTDDVNAAAKAKLRYRHIAEIIKDEKGHIQGVVKPTLIGPDHPLYAVDGVENAIIIDTVHLGLLTLIGPGAGMYPTGSAMVGDFLHIIGKSSKVLVRQ